MAAPPPIPTNINVDGSGTGEPPGIGSIAQAEFVIMKIKTNCTRVIKRIIITSFFLVIVVKLTFNNHAKTMQIQMISKFGWVFNQLCGLGKKTGVQSLRKNHVVVGEFT